VFCHVSAELFRKKNAHDIKYLEPPQRRGRKIEICCRAKSLPAEKKEHERAAAMGDSRSTKLAAPIQ
jgi:hypothetical protein